MEQLSTHSTKDALTEIRRTVQAKERETGQIPCMILDLDDTIFLQTKGVVAVAYHSVWNELKISNAKARENNVALAYEDFEEGVKGEGGLMKYLANRFTEKEASELLQIAFSNRVLRDYIRALPEHSGVNTLIEELAKSYNLILISKSHPELIKNKLELLGVRDDQFQKIISTSGKAKTSSLVTEIPETVFPKGLQESSVIIVGNSVREDLLPFADIASHCIVIGNEAKSGGNYLGLESIWDLSYLTYEKTT